MCLSAFRPSFGCTAISWDIRTVTSKCVLNYELLFRNCMNYGQHRLNANSSYPVVINISEASHLSCGCMFSHSQGADLFSSTLAAAHFILWCLRQLDWNSKYLFFRVFRFVLISPASSFFAALLCCFSRLYQVETGWCNSSLTAFIRLRRGLPRAASQSCRVLCRNRHNYKTKRLRSPYLLENVTVEITVTSFLADLACACPSVSVWKSPS